MGKTRLKFKSVFYKRVGLVLMFIWSTQILEAQHSWQFSHSLGVSQMEILELEQDEYWIMQTIASGEPITGHPIIRVIEFDKCGPQLSYDFTHPDIYGFGRIRKSFVDGDSIRIVIEVNPKVFHSHKELGLLSIHKINLGHHHKFLRADNVVHTVDFFKTNDGNYLAYVFLSYTDRPSQYGAFLLDPGFNILHYYENLSSYTITGGAIEVSDGFIFASSDYLYKLDKTLKPLWMKAIDPYTYLANFVEVDDGFVARVTSRRIPVAYELTIAKFDFDGNLLWYSRQLSGSAYEHFFYKMIKRPDGNIDVAVHEYDTDQRETNALTIFNLDQKTGEVVEALNAKNNSFINGFTLKEMEYSNTGILQLGLAQGANDHFLWNFTPTNSCNLEVGGETTGPTPLLLMDVAIKESIVDNVRTGNYGLVHSPSEITAQIICEESFNIIDQLPEDTSSCGPLTLRLNIDDEELSVIWEDNSINKTREITESGFYTFRYDDCRINYEETAYVEIQDCTCEFFIPNVFSPNNDGVNDYFKLENYCEQLSNFAVKIFNRWGGLVFESDDQYFEWNGDSNGKGLGMGVYVYLIEYTNGLDQQSYKEQGSITIVK